MSPPCDTIAHIVGKKRNDPNSRLTPFPTRRIVDRRALAGEIESRRRRQSGYFPSASDLHFCECFPRTSGNLAVIWRCLVEAHARPQPIVAPGKGVQRILREGRAKVRWLR